MTAKFVGAIGIIDKNKFAKDIAKLTILRRYYYDAPVKICSRGFVFGLLLCMFIAKFH